MTAFRLRSRFVLVTAAIGLWMAMGSVVKAQSGLVAAYSFDEGTGTTVADASGNGNTGTVSNTSWTASGKYGSALVFNGTSALVTIPDAASLRLTSGMTLELWVNPSTVTSAWRDLIYKGNDNYYLEATSDNSSRPAIGGTFSGANANLYGTAALAVNTWTHLAATYDGATLRLYVNGVQVSSVAQTGSLATSTNPLQIGGDSFFTQFFAGSLDEIRIYNVALTATQIQQDMATPLGTPPAPVPDLTIGKTHAGNFFQGQSAATYTLTVSNAGSTSTSGTVTVTDSVPAGLSATGIAGSGWSCTAPGGPCTRSDALAAGASYPPLTLTVNVAANAPASVTNTATVSGGGETNTANDSASDVTTIGSGPDLTISKSHAGTFLAGQTGATYTLRVTNAGGAPTSGTVTVTDSVPSGLTATSLVGTGWTCTQPAGPCSRSDALSGGASYPDLILTVNVAANPPASVTNVATVAGGGEQNTTNDTASDLTAIGTPTSGLVAAFAFNEGTGTTTADLSGNGNTGTLVNAAWSATGKFGPALSFNGTNALVNIPDAASLRLTTAMTLEAWVNPSTVNNKWRDVIYKGNDNYYLEGTSNTRSRPALGGTFGTSNADLYGTAALAPNTWTHLAGTYDGATLRLYVNGVQVSSAARTGSIATSTNPLQIGGDSLFGQYFSGTIDEVRVYNVALTAAQIQADMNTSIGSLAPDLALSKTHATSFTQGQTGAIYTLIAANGGTGPTSGTVTVTDTLPSALTATSFAGTGWACSLSPLSCTRSDALAAGNSYPAITLTVNVSTTAPASVTNTAAVSGGGDANTSNNNASDVTAIGSTTNDTEPPSAPGTLVATAVSGTEVDLTWGAATDNVGVQDYRVERCQGSGCTSFVKLAAPTTTSYSDTALSPNTTYSYIVRAEDAAGNLGPYSNVATVTTLSTVPQLVAAYSFDAGSGATAADSSGYGNNGTIANATWTTSGKYGAALSFNGTSARVSVPDAASLRLTTAMTLEAWVKPSAVTSNWRDVIYKGNDNYYLEGTSDSGGRPAAGGTFGSTGATVYAASALATNVWTHLAATYDGAVLRVYVNGIESSSAPRTGTLATSTNPLEIGGDSIFGQYFQGAIDEVRVYNVALTPTQIQTDMNTPVGSGSFPAVTLSRISIDFGSQATGTSSAPQTVTLTNTGGATLTVSGISVTGLNSGDFAQTNNCSSPIAPSGSCTISTVFTPTATGTRAAAVTITDNAPGSPHTVSLTGTGTGFSITPRVAVLTPGMTQQFAVADPNAGTLIWSVDGVTGGSASAGTITSGGLYTPPGTAGTHTVTVTTSDQLKTSSASVFITTHPGVFTHNNDNFRTGRNLNETVLTPANVNAAGFGKLASYTVDGMAQATPLYVANVSIPGVGLRNVVYVATQHDSVYAFDADGRSAAPYWQRSFINPGAGVTTVPAGDTGECCDISPEIGITGTPVIDPATGTLYVVAKTKEVSGNSTTYVQRLHALDITTGAEKFGGPVALQASVPGTGQGSQGNTVPFDALHENQRPALLLLNGVVYIGFGSHGDIQPYHGWILGYNASTLQQVLALNLTPNTQGAGIWQANGGLAADSAGNVYFITSNGTFNANTGGKEYGNTFVKIAPNGTVLDYFTPANQSTLDANNWDLGAAGPMLLPDQPGAHPHLLISAGKNNTIYLVDRDNMGHYNPGGDTQVVQALVNIFPFGTPEPGNYSAPVYFNSTVYFGPVADAIQAFRLTNGLLSTTATQRSAEVYSYPGAALAISANGSANGILWAIQRKGDCGVQVTCGTASPGVLRAYDANDLTVQLYASDQSGSRDTLDYAAKFSVPVVVNGKVFVTSMSKLTIYGFIP